MNPRILKKLSKKADPIVSALYPNLLRFVTQQGDSIDTHQYIDKKYRTRIKGKPNEFGYFLPLHNTIGYGEKYGYDEPEWLENDAYTILFNYICEQYTDWENWDEESYPQPYINIKTPSDVFKHAKKLLNH